MTYATDLLAEINRTAEQAIAKAYQVGYDDGSHGHNADWVCALTEFCELPVGINPERPGQVAEYIDQLQVRIALQGDEE